MIIDDIVLQINKCKQVVGIQLKVWYILVELNVLEK